MPRSEDGGSSITPSNRSSRPNMSRNTSANTTVLREGAASSPRPSKAAPSRPSEQSGRRRLTSLPITSTAKQTETQPSAEEPVRSPSLAESSSSSSDDESSPAQSRIIRRPPRFQQQDQSKAYPDDDDDESEPAFQPYRASADQSAAQDLASTLRGDSRHAAKKSSRKENINQSQTSDSSIGSGAKLQRQGKSREQRPQGPLSPRRTAELSGKSPSGKSRGYSREGSEGTPSMGSSFSDLDGESFAFEHNGRKPPANSYADASVTQSALEEALASHMNRGGASRFSISQAFRSRHTQSSGK